MVKQLIITGSGIKALSHITKETEIAIEQADYVLYLVNEPITAQWIENKSQQSESLDMLYFSEKHRADAYKKIIERVQFTLMLYQKICMVVYGHPLLLSNAVSGLIESIDPNHVQLIVLPALSAFDCLLADLAIDPISGCFSIDAGLFIHNNEPIYTRSHLILWQVGVVGDHSTHFNNEAHEKLNFLKERLIKLYNPNQTCIFYEASMYPHIAPKIIKTQLSEIDKHSISRLTTLYVPPLTL